MRHRRIALVSTIARTFVLADCGSSAPSATKSGAPIGAPSGDPIVIGYAAELSSTYPYYDVPMKQGATMAADEINAAGGVLGRPLRLDVVDQRNDPAESSKVTQQMADDGVSYVQTSAVGAETTEE